MLIPFPFPDVTMCRRQKQENDDDGEDDDDAVALLLPVCRLGEDETGSIRSFALCSSSPSHSLLPPSSHLAWILLPSLSLLPCCRPALRF